ncbi:MAG: response regulator transcription factor [Lachnospiraceae bacterium]|nr:response regulator transcription factor [Lachnospiraceae bacterium]
MYLIALCDDETTELDKTEQIFTGYGDKHPEIELKIKRFASADELIYAIREKQYTPDLITLDIYMPDKTGIDAARELRDIGISSPILFLTTSKEHALDAFGVEAVQYLVKPVSPEMLYPVLDRLLTDTPELRKKYILLRIDGKIRRVAVDSIVYCEAQGKMQCLYFSDGTHCLLRITMTAIFDMFSPYREFARVGVSYLVNLKHVESLSRQELQMDDGKNIYPPRGSYQSLREQYFSYYCEEDDENSD